MYDVKEISQQPISVWKGQTVITTAQLAEVYGTTAKNVTHNFSRNKDRFQEGKHFFALQGEELKEFMRVVPESHLPQSTSQLYLWTRRGASRHCKILGTDKAWEQFDYLEENYFDRQSSAAPQLPTDPMKLLEIHYQALKQVDQKVEAVDGKVGTLESRIGLLEDTMTLDHGQQYFLGKTVNKTVISALGGKDSDAYRQIGRKVFAECNGDLKAYFKVNARGNVPRKRYEEAVTYAEKWNPCTNTQMLIEQYNAQGTLDFAKGGAE